MAPLSATFPDLPPFIPPQLTQLVRAAPEGDGWVHEIKYDGYRMHARIDRGEVRLLTRTGLNWTHKYPPIAAALAKLPAQSAYLDGELCGVRPDGTTSFRAIQTASDAGNAGSLVFFLFDLCIWRARRPMPCRYLREGARGRAARRRRSVVAIQRSSPRRRRRFHAQACKLQLEGIVSKRADAAYAPGNRGLWVKTNVKRSRFLSTWAKTGARLAMAGLLGEETIEEPQATLKGLLAHYRAEEMVIWPVSKAVGNVKNNDPSTLQ